MRLTTIRNQEHHVWVSFAMGSLSIVVVNHFSTPGQDSK